MTSSSLTKVVYDDARVGTAVRKSFNTSILNDRVKEVCAACNNGWMSRLESDFKTTFMRLLASPSGVLTADDIRRLRRWAIKTHMIRSLKDRPDADFREAYSQAHRDAVRSGDSDLAGWDVWIGTANVTGVMYRHWGVSILGDDDLPAVIQLQSTLEIVGLILVVTYTEPSDWQEGFVDLFNEVTADKGLSMVHLKDGQQFFVWPTGPEVSHEAAIFLSDVSRQVITSSDMVPDLFDGSQLIQDIPRAPSG